MIRRRPDSPRQSALFPYSPLFRSWRRTASGCAMRARIADARCRTLRIGTVKLGGACLERADHLAQRAIEHLPRQHLEHAIAKREIDAEIDSATLRFRCELPMIS